MQFEDLLCGKPLEKSIDENVVFGDLKKNESAAWSLLLMAGYLKVTSKRRTEDGSYCTLIIPNREVRGLYRRIIEQWLSNGHGSEWFENFLNHLLTGNFMLLKRIFAIWWKKLLVCMIHPKTRKLFIMDLWSERQRAYFTIKITKLNPIEKAAMEDTTT